MVCEPSTFDSAARSPDHLMLAMFPDAFRLARRFDRQIVVDSQVGKLDNLGVVDNRLQAARPFFGLSRRDGSVENAISSDFPAASEMVTGRNQQRS